MPNPRCLPLFWLLLTLGGVVSADAAFDPNKLPREGGALADFTPPGWAVADKADGDLNGDRLADVAAILVRASAGSDPVEESQRVLLVLVSAANGKFLLGGSDQGLLDCVHCGGIKESAGIEIKKGVLIVNQMTGSREFTDQTWRFRYDPKTRRFALIGKDVTNGDSAVGTGDKKSFNFLTGVKISARYRYDQQRDREVTVSSKKEKIPKQTRFLGAVGGE